MSFLGAPLLWRSWFRLLLFWGTFATTLFLISEFAPYSNWAHVLDVLHEVVRGSFDHLSERSFAFALSSGIGQIAFALAIAFFVSHVLLLRATLGSARRSLGPTVDMAAFAGAFDRISERLDRNALVSHGWRQFSATVIRDDNTIRYTVRPQMFINLADARSELFGLKMMSSIPGYFVGLGLLLTFIGLVLALSRAAGSTAAGSAEAMTASLNELLAAATFKFSTSIAGLGASLALALAFRTYQIWIEGAFEGFSRAIERRMIFSPPQRATEESLKILAAQRDQLKEINSERFFTRLGDSVAPALGDAISKAVAPLSDRLAHTAEELTRTSRSGADSLVQQFVERLDQGANREMQEIVGTLQSLREALDRTQLNLSGSGQDFSVKVAQAAEAIEDSTRRSVKAGEEAAAASTESARETMQALQLGMNEVFGTLRTDIAVLAETLRIVSSTLSGQSSEMDKITERSRDTANAFSQVAIDVRSASQPLLTQSARVADSTERMSTSIEKSVETLSTSQQSADKIALQLSTHMDQIARIWDQYETRFKSVDEDLGRAADRFHEEVSRHQEAIRDFVKKIDDHTGSILGKINSAVGNLSESVETLHETLDLFLQKLTSRDDGR